MLRKIVKNKIRIWLVLGTALLGCSSFEGPPLENVGASDVLAEVKLSAGAAYVAKGDSLEIGFDLIAADGSIIPYDSTSAKWTTSFAAAVPVTNMGVVFGYTITESPVRVTLQYKHNYITKSDTIDVYVTELKQAANQLKLVSLDSNRVGGAVFGTPRIRVDLYKDGVMLTEGSVLPVFAESPTEAVINLTGGPNNKPIYNIRNPKNQIGTFWIHSSVNLYGNIVKDSLKFTGLYSDIAGTGTLMSFLPDNPPPAVNLDVIPLKLGQLCTIHLLINFSTNDTIDWVFSDSTASDTGCLPDLSDFGSRLGRPSLPEVIGKNALSVPPLHAVVRRSRTEGVIVGMARISRTKQPLPWTAYHVKQLDVEN